MARQRLIALGAVLIGAAVALVARTKEARPAWPCAWQGHSDTLVFGAEGRVFLRCATCQRETPGWDLVRAKEYSA